MSEGDDHSSPPSKRSFKRERVTLKWEAPPLLLPGEDPDDVPDAEASGELRLPDPGDAPALERPSRPVGPPPPALSDGADAWERDLPSLAPSSRPSTVPPAANRPENDGGALSLVDKRSRPSSPTIDLAAEMNDRFALGDFTQALRVAELILGQHPDHEAARRVSEAARQKLAQHYGSRLGSLRRRPRVAVDGADVRWLGLDHRAGFLLSHVDGSHTVEQLVDVSGMSRLEALKTLVDLLEMGAIELVD
jgi:hypothetical protein